MSQKPQQNPGAVKVPLNPAQKAAAEAKNGPLLIVAGAGTGKTKTLTSRILYLIGQGIAPTRICAITFTNKAAKEMARRVGREGPFIGTFHSFGARILRKECREAGRSPNFTIFDDHDSFDLVKKAVKKTLPKKEPGEHGDIKEKKAKKEENPVFFAQKISEIKNIKGTFEDLRRDPGKNALLLKVFDAYEAALRENNAFDFDDLIEKPVAIFNKNPRILKKYQDLFDAVLVDEYQDINPKQEELIALLVGEHRNLSVVGDDEQTIYSWRYADIKMFLGFERQWKGAAVHFLEENYRSTGTIIEAAAGVVKNNRFRTPKNLWTQNPPGDRIALFEAWGENEEAEWIAGNIKKIRQANSDADVAILYRTNAQSRAIEQALIRSDIPYRIFGGLKFYERREVKDAVAALRFISNPSDAMAKERLEKNLTKRKFAEFKSRAQNAGALPPLEALKLFLESFGYFEYLEENFWNADEREDNIAELIAFAAEFTSLPEMIERLSLLQATDDMENKNARGKEVSLMTIHLAKGLEFDSVFIAGASEGLLPHARSIDDEESLEEERRLMYVAMTRARKNLFLSFFGMPSRFVGEIPEHCITLGEDRSGDSHHDESEEEAIYLD